MEKNKVKVGSKFTSKYSGVEYEVLAIKGYRAFVSLEDCDNGQAIMLSELENPACFGPAPIRVGDKVLRNYNDRQGYVSRERIVLGIDGDMVWTKLAEPLSDRGLNHNTFFSTDLRKVE